MREAVDRRSFLRRAAGGVLVPGSVAGLVAACTEEGPRGDVAGPAFLNNGHGVGGYGPLVNDQGVVLLPEGFQTRAFGAIGDAMSDGNVTPLGNILEARGPAGS